ncbi:MAG: hypothetical protein HKM05_11185 [Spirochaetales bacterium]|nr:hypothetical protein [Spirochaetales bacterium]
MNSFPVAVPEAAPPTAVKSHRPAPLTNHNVARSEPPDKTQSAKDSQKKPSSNQKPKSFQKLLEAHRATKAVLAKPPSKPDVHAKHLLAPSEVKKAPAQAQKLETENSEAKPALKKLPLVAAGKKIQLAKSGLKKLTPPPHAHKKNTKKEHPDSSGVVAPAVLPQILPMHPLVQPALKTEAVKLPGKEGKAAEKPAVAVMLTPAVPAKGEVKPHGPKLSLLDLRHPNAKVPVKPTAELASAVTAVESKDAPKSADNKTSNSFQAVFQSVSGNSGQNFTVPGNSTPVPTQDLSALHRFLNTEGPGKIAEQARFILKDNDRGEIRLTLYPESLGKVKIALNLNGHHLDGRIFVENQNVKDVFQQNLNSLAQSLRDSGWSELSLNVTVGGQDQPKDGSERQSSEGASAGYGHHVKGDVVQASGGSVKISGWSDRLVNLQA